MQVRKNTTPTAQIAMNRAWSMAPSGTNLSDGMPGVAALQPARFALGLSAVFRTTPGLILFYSFAGEDCSDLAHWWACHLAFGDRPFLFFNPSERFRTCPPLRILF